MLSIMMKLLPMAIVASGSMKAVDKMDPLIEYVKTVVVQFEVSNIAKNIKLDALDQEDLPKQNELAEYIRRNVDVSVKVKRDPSRDFWEMPYAVTYTKSSVTITSAGPDKKFKTADDIFETASF